ncbi:TPA: glycosyltransferase [Streptococcus suis]|nr:glycosyltransferase [Streptococcus suis]NQO40160.1 glycosyltransferase [Streptococcus suis]NQP23575.1 glycosyltransferase [Streptococcus suis]NQP25542.1 glycosyltransferase [Streptococcus suis]QBQ85338.1 glycosyltransferase [Streptococcus suis]
MTIIVYAVASRSGGALSVLNDFYEEVRVSQDKYPDIKWVFVLSDQKLASIGNITIVNIPWVTKSFFHRLIANLTTVKKLYQDNQASVIVSLQNMKVFGLDKPTIVSLHNVLPLYKCGFQTLGTLKAVIKQFFVNHAIIRSLKTARSVLVPSFWIQEELVRQFGIEKSNIKVCKTPISPSIVDSAKNSLEEPITFFYPAASYPYKNHKAIMEAIVLMERKGNYPFKVVFTFDRNQSKNATNLWLQAQPYLDKIEFCGELPRNEVLTLYSSGILLFPSKIETDAMPLLEGMQAHGKIIAADYPYAKEVLDGYDNILFFEGDSPSSLAEKMTEIISTGVFPTNLSSKSANMAKTFNSRVDTIIESLSDI